MIIMCRFLSFSSLSAPYLSAPYLSALYLSAASLSVSNFLAVFQKIVANLSICIKYITLRSISILCILSSCNLLVACAQSSSAVQNAHQSSSMQTAMHGKIDGRVINQDLHNILVQKPVFIAATNRLNDTKQRNRQQLERLTQIKSQMDNNALTRTAFNRQQQLDINESLSKLLKYSPEAEFSAINSQRIYLQAINLYQCNSRLIAETRSQNPNAKQLPPLIQLNKEIEKIKLNIYDFSASEFKAWSKIYQIEISLDALDQFWSDMQVNKNSMFYVTEQLAEQQNIINYCFYVQRSIDKNIQDILFSYEGLAEYNKALKKLRGFYKRSNVLAINR